MPKRPTRSDGARRHLADIRDNLARIDRFIGRDDYEAFVRDEKTVFAVIRCLEIISEASRRLSKELKSRHQGIDWDAMAGAGNVYRHDYEFVELQYIWRTVREDLPPLKDAVEFEFGRTT